LDSEVPPLNNNRGSCAARPLNSKSNTTVTQKSFSTFYNGVPKRMAVAKKSACLSVDEAEMTRKKSVFIFKPRFAMAPAAP
jgi:hypothetical protein